MRLYIVRHGESVANQKKIHGDTTTPLSDLGTQQAHSLRDHLHTIHFHTIYASPCTRSQQTAEIINQGLAHPVTIEQNSLIDEKRGATAFATLTREEMPWDIIKAHRHDPNWHYEDEDSKKNRNTLRLRRVGICSSGWPKRPARPTL